MDKVQFSQRESSLKYLIGAFENEHGWLNSVRVNPSKASLGVNAAAIVQLGEALSTKKQATLQEYFETWYRAFKQYETVSVKPKPATSVRKAFKSRFGGGGGGNKDKDKPSHSDSSSHLSSEVSSMSISEAPHAQSQHSDEQTHLLNVPPFPLDGRVVFLCLCQTVLVMYEAIQELSTREWSPQEKDLYTKLDFKIKTLVIDPGVKMMDNDAQSVIGSERRFLRFMR